MRSLLHEHTPLQQAGERLHTERQDSVIQNSESEAPNLESPTEDFQKKIMPWNSAQFDDEISSYHARRKASRQQLIVVASLIDKIPNLAGLARTCEIFNATALVLPSLKILKEHAFQSISVTAEKWVPLEEVPSFTLPPSLSLR